MIAQKPRKGRSLSIYSEPPTIRFANRQPQEARHNP
jgi:hypothetical protein